MCALAASLRPVPPSRVTLEVRPGARARSLLTIDYGISKVHVPLPPYLVSLLRLLFHEWREDAGTSELFRGLRSAEYIAGESQWWPQSGVLLATTVRDYVKRLRRRIARAVRELEQTLGLRLALPQLIVGDNGYRLGRDRIEFIGIDPDDLLPAQSTTGGPSSGPTRGS
jgi:hypothetical protein